MAAFASLDDIATLRETDEIEVKLAGGRDGRGELPRDFWPTYSAFANGIGGIIILGLREQSGNFVLEQGLTEPDRIRAQLFDQLNNLQKVSCNLVAPADVDLLHIDGRTLMSIRVPAASRTQKPVFVNGNPLTGTYRRLNDGDRLCPADVVRRMLAEQAEDSRDDRVLRNYTVGDLNPDSIEAYRRSLRDANAAHPFLDHDGLDFLRQLRAWRTDRETGHEGLTVAGLLMFGRLDAILDEYPNYALDYQERDERTADRWVDRMTTDGTWSGNLFDFYRQVWRRLITGLKVPFRVVDGRRRDETSAHTALREAFVNAMVHADFTERASILIVRRADMFGFRNPGKMRVTVEQAFRGGESDGRNRTLQQMFLLIGAGERAGSGIPKIRKGWREQHWRAPALYERDEPSGQTLLELHMEDLLPAGVSDALRGRLGPGFDELSPAQRIVLSAAVMENTVTHARAMSLCDMHPGDMTKLLQGLVQQGCLSKAGHGRGTRYHLPDSPPPSAVETFADGRYPLLSGLPQPPDLGSEPPDLGSEPPDPGSEPPDPGSEPPDPVSQPPHFGSLASGDTFGAKPSDVESQNLPLLSSLDAVDSTLRSELVSISRAVEGARTTRRRMEGVIASLCDGRYLTLKVLAQLLGRSEDHIRKEYINPLARNGDLLLAFPHAPNDPRQAYTTFQFGSDKRDKLPKGRTAGDDDALI